MIEQALNIYKEKGKITKEDIVSICIKYNYGEDNPEKYWFKIKALFERYKDLLGY